MSGEATETTTTTAPDGAGALTVSPEDINYEGVSLARSGVEATEDGQAPGDAVEDASAGTATAGDATADTATTQTDDERAAAASEAGRALAGRKNTLVDDLKATRDKLRDTERQLDDERRLLDSWKPILQKLDGRPDLQQAVLNGAMTVAQAETAKDRDDAAELKDIAEDLGYYKLKTDGTPDYDQPDLERAQRYVNRHIKIAEKVAKPLVQPFAEHSQEQKIHSRISAAVTYATSEQAKADGMEADPAIVREMFEAHARKNPMWALDNDSGNILYERAVLRSIREGKVGKAMTTARPTATTRTDPGDKVFVHTEAPGGQASGPKLTQVERDLGQRYGITDKDWERAEQHAGVRRGYSRLTED